MNAAEVDRARLQMVEELHIAVYGATWARPETPQQVWNGLLREVRRLVVLDPGSRERLARHRHGGGDGSLNPPPPGNATAFGWGDT